MEAELNIANILKDKPNDTKLYADAFGELSLERVNKVVRVNEVVSIFAKTKTSTSFSFYSNGKCTKEGEPILVPSKKMRDWNKFAWKTGDILVSNDGKTNVIFNKWEDDSYASFYGRHYLNNENKDKAFYYKTFVCITERYSLEDKDVAETYISGIEGKLGGKLNRETLEIERSDFKDGDIICVTGENELPGYIVIYKKQEDNHIYRYATVVKDKCIGMNEGGYLSCAENSFKRYATDSEKQQLFEALAKEGKRWDAEKKAIVDLKPKCEFKPFDKVLGRNEKGDVWEAELFSHYREGSQYPFRCIGYSRKYCIPYNEETAKLIGTTKEWKE